MHKLLLALVLLSAASTTWADYYCTVGSSALQNPADGTGSGCLLWDGVSAPPAPPAPPVVPEPPVAPSSGGGSEPVAPISGVASVQLASTSGGRTLRMDDCPAGDLSPSYYDRRCDTDPAADAFIDAVSAKLNSALVTRRPALRPALVGALSVFAAEGRKIPLFPSDSRRILESVAQLVAAGTGTVADVPRDAEFCSKDPSYADLSQSGVGRKLAVLVSCGTAVGQGTVVSFGQRVERAQAVVAFANAVGIAPETSAAPFADVPASLAPQYAAAQKSGLAMPDASGDFAPSGALTKSDLRRMMLAAGAFGAAANVEDSESPAQFADLVSALYAARKESAAAQG